MNTRRLPDSEWMKETCNHPAHNPPSHFSPPPGFYEHECPSCGHKTKFIVTGVLMKNKPQLKVPFDTSHYNVQKLNTGLYITGGVVLAAIAVASNIIFGQ